jgi:hypothetical protein
VRGTSNPALIYKIKGKKRDNKRRAGTKMIQFKTKVYESYILSSSITAIIAIAAAPLQKQRSLFLESQQNDV